MSIDVSTQTRRDAFIAAARDAFFTRGYVGTTMSSIAATVGGSKTTLWTHFPAKEDLFAAVVDDIVGQYGTALSVTLDPSQDIVTELHRFATAMMRTVMSPPIIALHRLVTGEAGRFPELGTLFYERGPRRGEQKLAALFASAMTDGRLRKGDPLVAARQFVGMLQAGCFQQKVLALVPGPTPEDAARDIDAAVDTFMRAWGAATQPPLRDRV